ncbi:MAG: hypothetical protein ACR2NX_00575, partial [Chthoniobacterales bacterium]
QFGARTQNISGSFANDGFFALVGDAQVNVAGNFTSTVNLTLDVFDLYQVVAFDGFPASEEGALPSKLAVAGNFSLSETNELLTVLFTPEVIDQVTVGGTATLGGKLSVNFAYDDSGATPDAVFTLLTSQHLIAGHFSNVANGERVNAYLLSDDPNMIVPLDYPAGSFRVDYSINELTLSDYQAALPAELRNLSTRVNVQTGDNVGIAGFIITGSGDKEVLVRALGPSLSVGGMPIAGRLDDTVLELHDSSGALVIANDDWMTSANAGAIENSGLAPTDSRESAILRSLAPGAYTAILRGKNDTSGIGSVEVYEVGAASTAHLGNLSTRGLVGTGNNVLIGGLISGDDFSGLTNIVVRAVGPSLAARGVSNALQDPVLEVHDGDGNLLASNDNWKSDQQAEIESYGLGLQDDRESALLLSVASATRTVIVRGAGETTGVALVEIYNVGPSAAAKHRATTALQQTHRPIRATSRALDHSRSAFRLRQ